MNDSNNPPAALKEASRTARLGDILGMAAIGALIAALPAARQLAHDGIGFWQAWPATAVVGLAPLVAGRVAVRHASLAFSNASTDEKKQRLWIAGSVGVTTALAATIGAILRERTHHHGLAGTTFAMAMAFVALGSVVVGYRVETLARACSEKRARLAAALRWSWIVLGSLAGAWVFARAARSSASDWAAGPVLRDVAMLMLAVAIAVLARPLRRVAVLIGPPLGLLMLVLGLRAWFVEPELCQKIREVAPVYGWPCGPFGR